MIVTLLITIGVESAVVLGYSIWRRKLFRPVLLTSILANIITQSLLWIALELFFRRYLIVLCSAEFLIWTIEGFLLYGFSANQLRFQEAMLLSLAMNLASFGLGWFLPI